MNKTNYIGFTSCPKSIFGIKFNLLKLFRALNILIFCIYLISDALEGSVFGQASKGNFLFFINGLLTGYYGESKEEVELLQKQLLAYTFKKVDDDC